MFTVRNVANLVPPCLVDQAQHGISAAPEYAVTALGVAHIIVFGLKTSLAKLLTFPWIEERVVEGRLRLHGWSFDIKDGEVHAT